MIGMTRKTPTTPSLVLRGLLSLSIPASIIIANLLLPLPFIFQQLLLGVVLVWFYVEMAAGFPFLRTGLLEKPRIKLFRLPITPRLYVHSAYAVLAISIVTLLFLSIGRSVLGEAVIAMLYLVPVIWSTVHWGHEPGTAAALTAALMFDFFFIPPFYTFTVGSLEGWLVLAIFLFVAIVVVRRIQAMLDRAQKSEHEAMLMYELSSILAQARNRKALARGVAVFLQRRYLANLVTISIRVEGEAIETVAYEPSDGVLLGTPDRVLALLDTSGLAGEIQIWKGEIELPAADSKLFRSFAAQVGQVLERIQSTDPDKYIKSILDDLSREDQLPSLKNL
jgi:hypothetical protein